MSLQDSSGRLVTSLRVSVTDKCNLRCRYCMPEQGVSYIPHAEILRYEEMERIIQVALQLGITKVRLTGGEPLIRKGIIECITRLHQQQGLRKIVLTTNGLLLPALAKPLRQAGIAYLNISLDTLNRERFQYITRFDKLDAVLRGIQAAQNAGFPVIKVNVVSIRGFNDDEVFDFVEFANAHDLIVRFIEYMPFPGNAWHPGGFLSTEELQARIAQRYRLIPRDNEPSSSASTYTIQGKSGRIGFISPVSQSFCARCNRLRLTADGYLRPCLHGNIEIDVKTPLRHGASDADIANLLWEAAERKPKSHQDFLDHQYHKPAQDREMVRIGG